MAESLLLVAQSLLGVVLIPLLIWHNRLEVVRARDDLSR
jgi:hypothetical protein